MKKGIWLIVAVAAGTAIVLWLFWHGTWFGARLDDDALIEAMAPAAKARDVQHGIEEITRRFDEDRVGMDRWAAALVDASRRSEDPVRIAAAWGMHFDAGRPEFVARLTELVETDASVLVRRNAASSLAKSGSGAGRAVLRSMLEPFTVRSPLAGRIRSPLAVELPARENAPVARLVTAQGAEANVLAPVPGRVLRIVAIEGTDVAAGDPVSVLAPDPLHARQAAVALAIVGTPDDLELLGLAAAPQSAFPDEVKVVAQQASDAIRARQK